MRHDSCGPLVGWGLAALVLGVSGAQASAFDVTINPASLGMSTAVLVFDFIDGGPPDNTVTLSAITSDGTQDSATIFGNITGTGPWIFTDTGSPELQVSFSKLGTSLTFSFTTTDNPPDAASTTDGFSLFIGSDPFTPLFHTSAPDNQNILFLYSIGAAEQSLTKYTPEQTDFSFSVTPVQAAPEPASLALIAAGLAALLARRRFVLWPHSVQERAEATRRMRGKRAGARSRLG